MVRNSDFPAMRGMSFQNVSESGLSFDDVLRRILDFISQDPNCRFQFAIGTDSQVHQGCTKFVTGIMIRRIGKGAWACYRQVVVPRELTSVKEKLAMETGYSQEVAFCFAEADAIRQMEELLVPYVYKGAALELYIDIDAGTVPIVNKTSLYVQEMVRRVEAMGTYAARVKPDSFAASAYANRFTKRPVTAL